MSAGALEGRHTGSPELGSQAVVSHRGLELESCARAGQDLNHRASSPAPKYIS